MSQGHEQIKLKDNFDNAFSNEHKSKEYPEQEQLLSVEKKEEDEEVLSTVYKPTCDITSPEALSAIQRASSKECKQKLADIACLGKQNQLYPQELYSTCHIKGKRSSSSKYVISFWTVLPFPHIISFIWSSRVFNKIRMKCSNLLFRQFYIPISNFNWSP